MSRSAQTVPGFFVLGATHHQAPLHIREKLSLAAATADQLHTELTALHGLREFAMLNTCNRVEFYGVAETAEAIERLDPLAKAASGLWRGQVEITGRTFGVAAQRTPELAEDTGIAVMMSEI